MKKNLFFLFVASLLAWACGPKDNYTITGSITGDAEGKQVALKQVDETDNLKTIDSAKVVNGAFILKGNVMPDRYLLQVEDVKGEYPVFIAGENDQLIVAIDPADIRQTKVEGSKINEDYTAYRMQSRAIQEAMNATMQGYYEQQQEIEAGKDKDKEKKIQEIDMMMEAEYNKSVEQVKESTTQFITSNIGNIAGWVVLASNVSRYSIDELKDLLKQIPNQENKYAGKVKERIENTERTAIGQPFADFELKDVNDQPFKLSALAGKGNVVVIDFWASWCGPCRRENPHMVARYAKYHEKGLDVLGVSRDRDKAAWMKAIESDKLTWNQVWDKDGAAGSLYIVDAIPTIIILDKEGKIIHRSHGEGVEEKLVELFGF